MSEGQRTTEEALTARARDVGPVDLLAIAAHRDDVELTCGGTLLRAADQGHRTAIIDLTRGEMGTRLNAGLPDAALFNTDENRRLVVKLLRGLRPATVILPFPRGRHPDHRIASELSRDACYLAGLSRYGEGEPHRPLKVLYALSYREDPVKPTFVVDIAGQFERKMEAIRCYGSQFDGKDAAGEIFPTGQDLYDLIETQSRHYGSLIRKPYGEPFWTEETVAVDDVTTLGVRSM